MKKALQFTSYIVGAITIIGAISAADSVFVAAGLISAIFLAKEIKAFIQDNSGGNPVA